jgi:hypothetical protein
MNLAEFYDKQPPVSLTVDCVALCLPYVQAKALRILAGKMGKEVSRRVLWSLLFEDGEAIPDTRAIDGVVRPIQAALANTPLEIRATGSTGFLFARRVGS